MKHLITPNSSTTRLESNAILGTYLVLSLLLWIIAPSVIPSPLEVGKSLVGLIENQGLMNHLWSSLTLNVEALAWSTVISLSIAYASTIPVLKPIAGFISRGRFLSIIGFQFLIVVFFGGGHTLKLMLLVFGETVYFVKSMAEVIDQIPQASADYGRTLRMSEWQLLWEMKIRATFPQAVDALIQTASMGWLMLTMVEGLVRSEGGIGALLLMQDKHWTIAGVFAVQIVFLIVGTFQDIVLTKFKEWFFGYSLLTYRKN